MIIGSLKLPEKLLYPRIRHRLIILGIALLPNIFCKRNTTFDKTRWEMKNDMQFPYRNEMLIDLTHNHKLVGIHFSQLTGILGNPDFRDRNKMGYKIIEDYGNDIDPIYSKSLIFDMSSDSITENYHVEEYKR